MGRDDRLMSAACKKIESFGVQKKKATPFGQLLSFEGLVDHCFVLKQRFIIITIHPRQVKLQDYHDDAQHGIIG